MNISQEVIDATPDVVSESILMTNGSVSIKDIKAEWERLGFGNIEFLSKFNNVCLVKCSERDVVRLNFAIRYDKTKMFTSAGKNRKASF